MIRYESFRHESKRLHAIRLAQLVFPVSGGPRTWDESGNERNNYNKYIGKNWDKYKYYSILKAEIKRVYFLNPADLGRWGGDFFPWRIGDYHRSCMIPTTLIVTACSDEDVDIKLRDAFCLPVETRGIGQVEVLSWFGYMSKSQQANNPNGQNPADTIETPAFHILGEVPIEAMLPHFTQLAVIFLQHQSIDILTDVKRFFCGLAKLKAGKWTNKNLGTEWTPLLCGLLKGNIDGFVILGKKWQDDMILQKEAEQLISHLTDRNLRKIRKGFWASVSPNAVYFAQASLSDFVESNLKLLDRLPMPVGCD